MTVDLLAMLGSSLPGANRQDGAEDSLMPGDGGGAFASLLATLAPDGLAQSGATDVATDGNLAAGDASAATTTASGDGASPSPVHDRLLTVAVMQGRKQPVLVADPLPPTGRPPVSIPAGLGGEQVVRVSDRPGEQMLQTGSLADEPTVPAEGGAAEGVTNWPRLVGGMMTAVPAVTNVTKWGPPGLAIPCDTAPPSPSVEDTATSKLVVTSGLLAPAATGGTWARPAVVPETPAETSREGAAPRPATTGAVATAVDRGMQAPVAKEPALNAGADAPRAGTRASLAIAVDTPARAASVTEAPSRNAGVDGGSVPGTSRQAGDAAVASRVPGTARPEPQVGAARAPSLDPVPDQALPMGTDAVNESTGSGAAAQVRAASDQSSPAPEVQQHHATAKQVTSETPHQPAAVTPAHAALAAGGGLTTAADVSATSGHLGDAKPGSPPVDAARIQAQVVRALSVRPTIRAGVETMTLQLEPEHLGKVEVKLVAGTDRLEVIFTAESGETQQALRDGAKELARQLGGRMEGRWQHVDVKIEAPANQGRDDRSGDQRQDQDRPRDGRRDQGQQERRRDRRQQD